MSETVIKVENLSKQYRLGTIGRGTLFGDLQSWWAKLRGQEDHHSSMTIRPQPSALNSTSPALRSQSSPVNPLSSSIRNPQSTIGNPDTFWALKNISFEVKQGEVLGIIGRNGAGKSTLLKIISQVTSPTEGSVKIMGRIGSLLEIGTGFHPELTGRENIYLNGTILGMRKKEIDKKFDEIVAFSGVEAFIDTPVKRYSSGMHVRLGFAVAAHLDPEILIIDEVLAVGDIEFQNKCLGKMKNVAGEGRTVLLVSHNMLAIRSLCHRAILLDSGEIVVNSNSDLVISTYLKQKTVDHSVASLSEIESRMEGVINKYSPKVRFREISLIDENGSPQKSFFSNEKITISIVFECFTKIQNLRITLYLVDEDGTVLLITQNQDDSQVVQNYYSLSPGVYKATCEFPPNTFGEKSFFLDIHLEYPKIEHLVLTKILSFDVHFKGYNDSVIGSSTYFRPLLNWEINEVTV